MAEDKNEESVKDSEAPESTAQDKPEEKEESSEAPSNLPEKFQGKSPDEIAQAYLELEKKLGEQSGKVGEAEKLRSELDQWRQVGQVLQTNPELYSAVDAALKGESPDSSKMGKKSDGEAKEGLDPRIVETRRAMQSQIVSDFESKMGLDKLSKDQRKDALDLVSKEFADLVDPSGSKSMQQILDEVSLDRLPKFLENAYWIAYKDKLQDDKSPFQDVASIGSMSSSSAKSEKDAGLTEQERKIASKLGISPDKYLKRKKELSS